MVLTRTQRKSPVGNRRKGGEINRQTSEEYPVYSRISTNNSEQMQKEGGTSEIKEAFSQIEQFNGTERENTRHWLNRIEVICDCFEGISEHEKFKRIPTKLGGEVFEWFCENKASIKCWETFKTKIMEKYPTIVTKQHPLLTIDDFNRRIKREDESIVQYYRHKLELANKIDLNMIDSMRVAALIDGLPKSFRSKLAFRKTEIDKPEKFLEIVQALEQEFELVERENQNDNLNASNELNYPSENDETNQLIGAVHRNEWGRSRGQETAKQQPRSMKNGTEDTIDPQHQYYNNKMTYEGNERYQTNRNNNWEPSNRQLHNPENYTKNRNMSTSSRPYDNNLSQTGSNFSWKTNQRPLACFQCGQNGHIARFCRNYQLKE